MGAIVSYLVALHLSAQIDGTEQEILTRAAVTFLAASLHVLVFAGGLMLAFFHPLSSVPGRKIKVLAWVVAIEMAIFAGQLILSP